MEYRDVCKFNVLDYDRLLRNKFKQDIINLLKTHVQL